MKKNIRYLLMFVTTCLIASIALYSCKGNKDESIMTAFEAKKKDMKELSNVTAFVSKGIVTLNGNFPDAISKNTGEQTVKDIPNVKQVINNCTVVPPPAPPAPVVIAADDPLTKDVTDALKDYPGVSATVKDGDVTLKGEIKRANLPKLMKSLHSLKPKKITNELTIK